MNRIEDYPALIEDMVLWIKTYAIDNNIESLVVGCSGGIDSSVVSTLCALTSLPTYAINMPILQNSHQEQLSDLHLQSLKASFKNVETSKINLTDPYFSIIAHTNLPYFPLANANTRSRLRMVTLYHIAANVGGIVVGTGNKVEDFGVGFYTKYGDGGVDISPIADLYKTEVWELGKHLNVDEKIINAKPTDGLWDDGRTDEDQLGTDYKMLEWAMENIDSNEEFTDAQNFAMDQYKKFNKANQHKMNPIPVYKLPKAM
jgi:NAD+ synthase